MVINEMKCYDAYQQEQFSIKCHILLQMLDYPGHSKLYHCAGKILFASTV